MNGRVEETEKNSMGFILLYQNHKDKCCRPKNIDRKHKKKEYKTNKIKGKTS